VLLAPVGRVLVRKGVCDFPCAERKFRKPLFGFPTTKTHVIVFLNFYILNDAAPSLVKLNLLPLFAWTRHGLWVDFLRRPRGTPSTDQLKSLFERSTPLCFRLF